MINKLEDIKNKYDRLTQSLADVNLINDMENWKKAAKEQSRLEPIVNKYLEYKKALDAQAEAKEILSDTKDNELKELAQIQLDEAQENIAKIEEELKIMLLPPDTNDEKNVIIEIRAGAGGEEAGLFGADLMRMYKMYASNQNWKVEDISINATEKGGVKEAVFSLSGENVYSKMKFESGVHRVQRVPETETQGRVHTSTVTVAVLPEADDVVVEINEKDLKIDTYRSGGAGGQHVNKTDSAIRITHLPTGLVVTCEDERSQIKNREKAMRVLKSRLYDLYQTQADEEYARMRRGQVGTGDRSERIRTYNFPQGRVTDHRIGLTIYDLENFLNGEIDHMVEQLRLADQTRKLQQSE
ncbi:MAG TPA: peptide chain release factor 1 [Clostridiales bacterium]|jgi:peptide chain release factor 1|nr:peptide chain release factor 1 [Clostridiales bacterium]